MTHLRPPLTIECKCPRILAAVVRGPELPLSRNVAPHLEAALLLWGHTSSDHPFPEQVSHLPGPVQLDLSLGSHLPSEPAGTYLRDRDSSPRLGSSSGDVGTRGCRGSQVASESQFHVSRGTSTSPRKMLRPRLSRCHTDRLSTRPGRSACWTECWGQEVSFSGVPWRPWSRCGSPVDWRWSPHALFLDGIPVHR